MARLTTPLEWALSATTDLILKVLPLRATPPSVTDEEIGFMLREGVAAGHIPLGETAIVEMALRLGDRRIGALMTPRTQIEFLDLLQIFNNRNRLAPGRVVIEEIRKLLAVKTAAQFLLGKLDRRRALRPIGRRDREQIRKALTVRRGGDAETG